MKDQTEISKLKLLLSDMQNNYIEQNKKLKKNVTNVENAEYYIEMRCMKFTDSEYIFDFVVHEDKENCKTYTIQIFNYDNIELGNIKMPVGIDMKEIFSETPLNNLLDMSKFLKNCKRYISIYHEKMREFLKLKTYVENSSNCVVDANYNYTMINIYLLNVYDIEINTYFNVMAYLFYKLDSMVPIKIKINVSDKEQQLINMDERIITTLESIVEDFNTLNLKSALQSISEKINVSIEWKLEFYDDSTSFSHNASKLDNKKKDQLEKSFRNQTKEKSKAVKRKANNTDMQKKKKTNKKYGQKHKIQDSMKQTTLNFTVQQTKGTRLQDKISNNKVSEKNVPNKSNDKSANIQSDKSLTKNAMKMKNSLLALAFKPNKDKRLNVLTSTPIVNTKSGFKKSMQKQLDISDITRMENVHRERHKKS